MKIQFKNIKAVLDTAKTATKIIQNHQKAVIRGMNSTAGVTRTQVVRDLSEATGYKVGRLKKRSRIEKAFVSYGSGGEPRGRFYSEVIFDSAARLNLGSLRYTRYNKSGFITYKWLGKTYRKRGFKLKLKNRVGESYEIAVRNQRRSKSQRPPEFKRSTPNPLRPKRKQLVAALTGPNVADVFESSPFQKRTADFIREELPKRIAYEYARTRRKIRK